MDLKLAKVLSWLQKNMDGEVSMTEDTISTVCNDVAEALRKQFDTRELVTRSIIQCVIQNVSGWRN